MEIDEQRVQAGTELMNFVKEYAKKYADLFGHGVLHITVTPTKRLEMDFPYEVHLDIKQAAKRH